ncbi:MAG TPA: dTDP-4-dehydrorhamnose 3,5-epimerase [bacterium]|nr:dTDP-4-dehydrorhamnose 3,5-epimerase [bacterium]HPN44411.1 dTDP-4-dehydrorhamnose 3,5-epimerase [bacterium]
MEFVRTAINDVILIKPQVFADQRGYFMETYHEKEYRQNGIEACFVQDNMSSSVQGTLRGLHYQLAPYAQGKLVRVTRGRVFDVAVDLRRQSVTFGQYVGVELSEENKCSLWVPPGFAHGFYVLSDSAEFTYKCTEFYNPAAERGISWNDPEINIHWPIDNNNIILSEKDKKFPQFSGAEINY